MNAIRDRQGRLIGYISHSGSNEQIRNAQGALLGTYNPNTKETRTKTGALFGHGNQLMRLLG